MIDAKKKKVLIGKYQDQILKFLYLNQGNTFSKQELERGLDEGGDVFDYALRSLVKRGMISKISIRLAEKIEEKKERFLKENNVILTELGERIVSLFEEVPNIFTFGQNQGFFLDQIKKGKSYNLYKIRQNISELTNKKYPHRIFLNTFEPLIQNGIITFVKYGSIINKEDTKEILEEYSGLISQKLDQSLYGYQITNYGITFIEKYKEIYLENDEKILIIKKKKWYNPF